MSDERGEMTPRELDELASAYLVGEATAEETALVGSDPRLQDLVEDIRAVRDLVATPVDPPSDEVRDRMIAQALDHRAPVLSLERARRRLRAIPPQARVVLAAAAVVAAIAMVGVTLFEQADRDGGDPFASSDTAEDAPAMAEKPASAPVPEGAALVEESPLELAGPSYADADMADAPAEAAEPIMPEEEEAAPESPEMFADDSAGDEPLDDAAEAEPAMDYEPVEVVPLSGEPPLVFDTQEDLESHVIQLVDEHAAEQRIDGVVEPVTLDDTACPVLTEEGVELLARFLAVVDGIEVEVSVYVGEDRLLISQTTLPPECEIAAHRPYTKSLLLPSPSSLPSW